MLDYFHIDSFHTLPIILGSFLARINCLMIFIFNSLLQFPSYFITFSINLFLVHIVSNSSSIFLWFTFIQMVIIFRINYLIVKFQVKLIIHLNFNFLSIQSLISYQFHLETIFIQHRLLANLWVDSLHNLPPYLW